MSDSQKANLWAQYQEKLAPVNQQSQSLLGDYYSLQAQVPTFQQRLLDAIKQAGQYPSQAALREEYVKNPNLTPIAVESLVSRRGQSTRGTIQDIVNRAYGGIQSDVYSRQGQADLAQQMRSNLLEEYGLAKGVLPSTTGQSQYSQELLDLLGLSDLLGEDETQTTGFSNVDSLIAQGRYDEARALLLNP